ncbi:MAG: hypothetical protein KAX99_09675, partial [Azonexus sp.]|nr:hypothetical protein [Azonexus sp.]
DGRRLRTALAVASDLGRLSFTDSVRYINSPPDGRARFIDRLRLSQSVWKNQGKRRRPLSDYRVFHGGIPDG